MASLDHYAYSQRMDGMLDSFCDLRREPFLHLKAARKGIYQARDLA